MGGEEAEEAAPVEEEEEFEEEEEEEETALPILLPKQLSNLCSQNIPDWFLLQTICFLESQRFAVLKTKWLCIFYVKLYWIFFSISTVTNKINTLGMEANTHFGRFCYSRRFLS